MWRHWVDRELPAEVCEDGEGQGCQFSAECHERFVLAGVPAALAPQRECDADPDDVWASWRGCPRRFLATYRIDQGVGSLAELLRWRLSCGVHRRGRLTAGGSFLLREYERMRDGPAELAEREAVHRAKEGGSGGGEDGGE